MKDVIQRKIFVDLVYIGLVGPIAYDSYRLSSLPIII